MITKMYDANKIFQLIELYEKIIENSNNNSIQLPIVLEYKIISNINSCNKVEDFIFSYMEKNNIINQDEIIREKFPIILYELSNKELHFMEENKLITVAEIIYLQNTIVL